MEKLLKHWLGKEMVLGPENPVFQEIIYRAVESYGDEVKICWTYRPILFIDGHLKYAHTSTVAGRRDLEGISSLIDYIKRDVAIELEEKKDEEFVVYCPVSIIFAEDGENLNRIMFRRARLSLEPSSTISFDSFRVDSLSKAYSAFE